MTKYHATNIQWDTDGATVELPNDYTVMADDIDDVANKLSDTFGFLIESLDVEEIF